MSITDVRCRPSTSRSGGEEQAAAHELVFPRAGVFVKHVGGQRAVADPNHVLFFNAGEPYRVSHPVPGGDDCTCFVFSEETLLEVLGRCEPALLVQGRQDLAGEANVYDAHLLIKSSVLKFINKCGHMPWLEQPEQTWKIVNEFLDGLPG